MKPEFMRLRRALSATVAAVLLAVGIVAVSPALSASAHNNTVTADCAAGLSVHLTRYPAGTRVTVEVDGATAADTTFSGSWSQTFSWDRNVDHGYTVTVLSPDDLNGSRGWSFTKSGTVVGCPPDSPSISAAATTCTGESISTGAVSFTLSGVTKSYTVALVSGGTSVATMTSSGGTGSFGDVGPGTYTVTASTSGGPSATSASVTVVTCTPSTPEISLTLVPCLVLGTLGPVTAELSNLAIGTAYTVTLYSAADVELATQPLTPTGTTATVEFAGFGPGEFYATVTDASGSFSSSANLTITECPPLDTLAPPSITLIAEQCTGDGIPPAPLTAQLIDLDAAQTYFVRVVDGSGTTVPGGEDQTVAGSTTATVTFPSVFAPGTYTAQLLVNPGMQLAATSPSAISATAACALPTLALTGPGALIPLGSVAALLLTLGGAVVTGRLRRRMAQ